MNHGQSPYKYVGKVVIFRLSRNIGCRSPRRAAPRGPRGHGRRSGRGRGLRRGAAALHGGPPAPEARSAAKPSEKELLPKGRGWFFLVHRLIS